MDLIRQSVVGPGIAGPTGPSQVVVLFVPTGGTYLNLDEPQLSQLREAVDRSIPLMMSAEGGPSVAYRFGVQGSGPRVDPAANAYGPTAANQAGVIFNNTRLPTPEYAPQGFRGLAVQAYGAVGTSTLRMWRVG